MGELTLGLKGLNAHNVGSHLMALAVRQAFPTALLGMPLRATRPPLAKLLAPSAPWLWTDIGGRSELHQINRRLARITGTTVLPVPPAIPRTVDAVLDISGFAYGGPFPRGGTLRLPQWIAQWARRDVPTVLLPQSFGPFEDQTAREHMARAMRRAALVFARDDDSARALSELDPRVDVRRAPDIAIASAMAHPSGPGVGVEGRSYVLVLPNRQVLRKTDCPASTYLDALVAIAERARCAGHDVVVASHEGTHDLELARAIQDRVPEARLLDETALPTLLGAARGADLVVSSRLHGLVAALSNGVPVVSVGWARKYQYLLADFEVPEAAVDVNDDRAHLSSTALATFEAVLADSDGYRRRIVEARGKRLAELDLLWASVRAVVGDPGT